MSSLAFLDISRTWNISDACEWLYCGQNLSSSPYIYSFCISITEKIHLHLRIWQYFNSSWFFPVGNSYSVSEWAILRRDNRALKCKIVFCTLSVSAALSQSEKCSPSLNFTKSLVDQTDPCVEMVNSPLNSCSTSSISLKNPHSGQWAK